MSKDPSFLLYSSDFLIGCSDLTMEERGQYITLMCLQHQKGHLNRRTIDIAIGTIINKETGQIIPLVSEYVLEKFSVDENGCYYNKRLEEETIKRRNFVESRKSNLSKSSKSKEHISPHMEHHMETDTESHMENENVNENINKNKDDIYYIISEYKFSDLIVDSITKWLKYKKEKKQTYKKTGLKTLLNKIQKEINENGEQFIVDSIEHSITNNYSGIYPPSAKKTKNEGGCVADYTKNFEGVF